MPNTNLIRRLWESESVFTQIAINIIVVRLQQKSDFDFTTHDKISVVETLKIDIQYVNKQT